VSLSVEHLYSTLFAQISAVVHKIHVFVLFGTNLHQFMVGANLASLKIYALTARTENVFRDELSEQYHTHFSWIQTVNYFLCKIWSTVRNYTKVLSDDC